MLGVDNQESANLVFDLRGRPDMEELRLAQGCDSAKGLFSVNAADGFP